jgi:hypothetical protein
MGAVTPGLESTPSRRGLWRWLSPERPAQSPARHPYLIMNPKSGGGKVGKFDLKRKAEDLSAEAFLIGGSEPVDVAKIARGAAERGAEVRVNWSRLRRLAGAPHPGQPIDRR